MRRRGDKTPSDRSLDRVQTSSIGRSLTLMKLTVTAGAKAAGHAVGSMFVDKRTKRARRDAMVADQFDRIVEELGKLKGSLMKAGQLVSMYGDYFFPPKFNKILKHLQADSTPLAWSAIRRQLAGELGTRGLAGLAVEETPFAAASLGQVHLARRPGDDRQLCVKVQYPGIDLAVDSDLRSLRPLLSLLRLGEHGERFDDLIEEFRTMMLRELDYVAERQAMEAFRAALAGDRRYVIPETVAEVSSSRVLTSTFQPGVSPDDPAVLDLSQARRNALGGALVDLFFFEIFQMRQVQTDPHFGNFRVQVGASAENDRLVLLDFGSMRDFSPSFTTVYGEYVAGAFLRDRRRVVEAATQMGLLLPSDGEDVRTELFELTGILMEPLKIAEAAGAKQTLDDLEDFPRLISAKTRRFIDKIDRRPPPRELLLLDRKLLGVFVFLATLKALVPGRQIIGKYVTL